MVFLQLTCKDLFFMRENFSLQADCSFCEGIHIITGRIGSGKSTFAKLLSGYLPSTGGFVLRDGISSMMLSLQFPEFHFTEKTLNEEVKTWEISQIDLLENADLKEKADQDLQTLSRGEQKRLQLFLSISVRPDLLILDEPFSTLDSDEKKKISDLILIRKGITLIFCHTPPDTIAGRTLWKIENGILQKESSSGEKREFIQNRGNEKSSRKKKSSSGYGLWLEDLRVRIVSSLILSTAAYLSIEGALLVLVWWLAVGGPLIITKRVREVFSLLILLLIIAVMMAFMQTDWVSYLLRTSTVILIAISLFSDVKPNEFRDATGALLHCNAGFEAGIIAELMHQSLITLKSDWTDVQLALALKGRKKGISHLIPAAFTIIIRAMRRSQSQAILLTLRGYRGEGTLCPLPPPCLRDILIGSAAIIPLLFSLIKPGDIFILID